MAVAAAMVADMDVMVADTDAMVVTVVVTDIETTAATLAVIPVARPITAATVALPRLRLEAMSRLRPRPPAIRLLMFRRALAMPLRPREPRACITALPSCSAT